MRELPDFPSPHGDAWLAAEAFALSPPSEVEAGHRDTGRCTPVGGDRAVKADASRGRCCRITGAHLSGRTPTTVRQRGSHEQTYLRVAALAAVASPFPVLFRWTTWLTLAVVSGAIAYVVHRTWHNRLRIRQMQQEVDAQRREARALADALSQERAKTDAQRGELEQQAARVLALDRQRRRFLAGVMHEMRTPLAVVRGVLDGDLTGPDAERARENVRRMTALVDEISEFAMLGVGDRELRREPVDLTGLLRGVARISMADAERHGVDVRLVTARDHVWARVDAEAIRKATEHLVETAVRQTHEGGEVRVIHTASADRDIRISIEYDGSEGETDGRGPAGERFAHGGPSDGVVGGDEIRLALVRELVDLHGGRLSSDGDFARGAHFVVDLPGAAVEPMEMAEDGLPSGEGEEGVALVVDDHADVRMLLRAQLREHFRVIEAPNGTAALDAARRERPDLVITDLMMPGRDGLSVIAEMHADPALDDVPLLVISARHDKEADAYRAGADAFVTKPWGRDSIVAQARALVGGRRVLRDKYRGQVVLPDGGVVESDDAAFVRRLTDAIDEHLGDSGFGVAELAEAMAMSRQHLAREVRRVLDTTASDLLLQRRMERGASLLQGGVRRVSEVARAVGIDNTDRFSRQFRAHFGVPPSEYRDTGTAN